MAKIVGEMFPIDWAGVFKRPRAQEMETADIARYLALMGDLPPYRIRATFHGIGEDGHQLHEVSYFDGGPGCRIVSRNQFMKVFSVQLEPVK